MIDKIRIPQLAIAFLSGILQAASPHLLYAQELDLYAPMSISASDGDYTNKIGITWDAVRSASSYRIFRSEVNDFSTSIEIGETEKGYYFDQSSNFENQSVVFYFWIQPNNGSQAGDVSLSDDGFNIVPRFNPDQRIPQLAPPPEPPENPTTAAKALLGKTLFWEEQISSTNTMACGTCHQPASGGNNLRSTRIAQAH